MSPRVGADVLLDFEDGLDVVQVNGVSFSDLTIQNTDDGAIILLRGERLALIEGLDAVNLLEDDFIFT